MMPEKTLPMPLLTKIFLICLFLYVFFFRILSSISLNCNLVLSGFLRFQKCFDSQPFLFRILPHTANRI